MLVTGVETSTLCGWKWSSVLFRSVAYLMLQFMLQNFHGKGWNKMICKVSSNPSDSMILCMLSCGSRLSKNLNLKRRKKKY